MSRDRPQIEPIRRIDARILVVEGNFSNREVALDILKKLGIWADSVVNGVQAIKALETNRYDMVLMDVQMPEMDGVAATRVIRDPRSGVLDHAVPIVALTATALDAERKRCLEAGMNSFLSKPITPYMLRDLLEQWLPEGEGKKLPESNGRVASVHKEEKRKALDLPGVTKCMMGDETLAMHVIEAFLSDFPNQLQALKDSTARGDAVGAARHAHSIKGASASAGGMRIRERALAMEKAGDAGNLRAVEGSIFALEEEFMEFTKAVQEECHARHD